MKAATKTFDVVILGTGMSGTILASILLRRGLTVALIDEKGHPRFAVGESTIPHTSLLLSILAARHGVPEIDYLAYPDRIARHIATTCGIKRSFGFAYHRPGMEHDHREGMQFGTSSKDENHLFRQDVDAYLVEVARRYGAEIHLRAPIENVRIDAQGAQVDLAAGGSIRARFVVDGTGYRSPLARLYGAREEPTRLRHHSRSLFTHMIGVGQFAERESPLSLPWELSTLHHVFDGGWFWVIPFNNAPWSTNPLVSVGLTLDPRMYPRPDKPPEDEFREFLGRFPSVAPQFAGASAARPWVSTGRLQYSSKSAIGYRYCLMSHAAGAVDALFSRGLINTMEVIRALIEPLTAALAEDDFSVERFQPVAEVERRSLNYNDDLVRHAFASWASFELWNAWSRVWALGTIITEFRVMNALTDYTASGDARFLDGEAKDPVSSPYEDPDYGAFFRRAVGLMDRFVASSAGAAETARGVFDLTRDYAIPVPIRLESLRRAGWLRGDDEISERNLGFARQGYRWAIANPDSRDLFGCSETFYRWRARQADPHL